MQTYNPGYNNDIFQKNAFLNLETLLKDIFEKCWHQRSCVVKMNSLSDLFILQSDNILYFCFAYALNNITITLKMSLKNRIFSEHLQENADFIKFLLAPRLQKVCNLIQLRLSYIHAMFHEPSSSGSNFR